MNTKTLSSEEMQDVLWTHAQHLRTPCPFVADDIVTPRKSMGFAEAGIPCVVVRVQKLARNRNGYGNGSAYGKQADIQIAFIGELDELVSVWTESQKLEAWNSAHAAEYNRKAKAYIDAQPSTASANYQYDGQSCTETNG